MCLYLINAAFLFSSQEATMEAAEAALSSGMLYLLICFMLVVTQT